MPTSWAPDTGAVAARLPARLGGSSTFTVSSIPTLAQAQEIIDQAVTDVIGAVGSFDPAAVINPADVERGEDPITLGDLATTTAALDSAAQVELLFWPEQVVDGPYVQLNERYKTALGRLEQAILEHRSGGVVPGRGTPQPLGSFPCAEEWPL